MASASAMVRKFEPHRRHCSPCWRSTYCVSSSDSPHSCTSAGQSTLLATRSFEPQQVHASIGLIAITDEPSQRSTATITFPRLQSLRECSISRTIPLEDAGKPPWPPSSQARSPRCQWGPPPRTRRRATYRDQGVGGALETCGKVVARDSAKLPHNDRLGWSAGYRP